MLASLLHCEQKCGMPDMDPCGHCSVRRAPGKRVLSSTGWSAMALLASRLSAFHRFVWARLLALGLAFGFALGAACSPPALHLSSLATAPYLHLGAARRLNFLHCTLYVLQLSVTFAPRVRMMALAISVAGALPNMPLAGTAHMLACRPLIAKCLNGWC